MSSWIDYINNTLPADQITELLETQMEHPDLENLMISEWDAPHDALPSTKKNLLLKNILSQLDNE